jgi:hypothetical protein
VNDHKHNAGIREEFRITYMSKLFRRYSKELARPFGKML